MDRRTLRTRKISQRMSVVDESERRMATVARLEALENDFAVQDSGVGGSSDDEEFVLEEEPDEEGTLSSKKKPKKRQRIDGGMRKTRGMVSGRTLGPKMFLDWLEELDARGSGEQKEYLSAAADPPESRSSRKLCSVCGSKAPYTCVRCGSRFCCLRCHTIHADTRCLKFMT